MPAALELGYNMLLCIPTGLETGAGMMDKSVSHTWSTRDGLCLGEPFT